MIWLQIKVEAFSKVHPIIESAVSRIFSPRRAVSALAAGAAFGTILPLHLIPVWQSKEHEMHRLLFTSFFALFSMLGLIGLSIFSGFVWEWRTLATSPELMKAVAKATSPVEDDASFSVSSLRNSRRSRYVVLGLLVFVLCDLLAVIAAFALFDFGDRCTSESFGLFRFTCIFTFASSFILLLLVQLHVSFARLMYSIFYLQCLLSGLYALHGAVSASSQVFAVLLLASGFSIVQGTLWLQAQINLLISQSQKLEQLQDIQACSQAIFNPLRCALLAAVGLAFGVVLPLHWMPVWQTTVTDVPGEWLEEARGSTSATQQEEGAATGFQADAHDGSLQELRVLFTCFFASFSLLGFVGIAIFGGWLWVWPSLLRLLQCDAEEGREGKGREGKEEEDEEEEVNEPKHKKGLVQPVQQRAHLQVSKRIVYGILGFVAFDLISVQLAFAFTDFGGSARASYDQMTQQETVGILRFLCIFGFFSTGIITLLVLLLTESTRAAHDASKTEFRSRFHFLLAVGFGMSITASVLPSFAVTALSASNQDAGRKFFANSGLAYDPRTSDAFNGGLQQLDALRALQEPDNVALIRSELERYMTSMNVSSLKEAPFLTHFGAAKVELATGKAGIAKDKGPKKKGAKTLIKKMEYFPPDGLKHDWESGHLRSPALGLRDPVMEAEYFPRTIALVEAVQKQVPVALVNFVLSPPTTILVPHEDPYPGVMRYFLTLDSGSTVGKNENRSGGGGYLATYRRRNCPQHIPFTFIDSGGNSNKTFGGSNAPMHQWTKLQNDFVWGATNSSSDIRGSSVDGGFYRPPVSAGWDIRPFKTGDAYVWDGYWHCHFVANPSPQPRLALVLVLEKTFTGMPLWVQWLNHFTLFSFIPALQAWGVL
jgi:hypothetical protein